MKNLLLATLSLVCTAILQAQSASRRTEPVTASPGSLSISSLKVDGLSYARDIDRIYWGDFDEVHLDRDGLPLSMMMDIYMRYFGSVCAEALPKNKVKIMNAECKTESYRVYAATGFEVPGSRMCEEDRIVWSGLYAEPQLDNAHEIQTKRAGLKMLGQIGSAFTKTGTEGVSFAAGTDLQNFDYMRQTTELKSDMKGLVAENACSGAPLRRFEHNLIAFVSNIAPVRMADIPVGAGFTGDSDYQTLLDDLVAEQSTHWIANRFQRGSIANVSTGPRDAIGRQTSVSANYAYLTLDSRTARDKQVEGKVELRFQNGSPLCLVYEDLPTSCRVLSPKLVAAYEDGKYVTTHPAVARTYVAPDLREVRVSVDTSQPVLVEVPAAALNSRMNLVVGAQGKLLRDVHGIGPGGTIVLAHAGSSVLLSVYNTQRSIKINLSRIVVQPNEAINFGMTSREFFPGKEGLPHDGNLMQVSFDVPSRTEQTMLLTDFEKKKVASSASTTLPNTAGRSLAPSPATPSINGSDSNISRVLGTTDPHKVLLAGTLLQMLFASPITVDQVTPGKLFRATIVRTRSSAITGRGKENLPEGTTVFVKITPTDNGIFLIEADHALIDGASVILTTSVSRRPAMRVPLRGELQGSGGPILVPAQTIINLTTKGDAALPPATQ